MFISSYLYSKRVIESKMSFPRVTCLDTVTASTDKYNWRTQQMWTQYTVNKQHMMLDKIQFRCLKVKKRNHSGSFEMTLNPRRVIRVLVSLQTTSGLTRTCCWTRTFPPAGEPSKTLQEPTTGMFPPAPPSGSTQHSAGRHNHWQNR